MADTPPGPKYGLPTRLVAGVLGFSVLFGVLWPLGMWLTGDSRGLGADIEDGLLNGAMTGVLMTFLGEPLTRWLDGLFRRLRGPAGREGGDAG